LHQRTEYYEAVRRYSKLEQYTAPVMGGRVPIGLAFRSPFFINTFSIFLFFIDFKLMKNQKKRLYLGKNAKITFSPISKQKLL
jgi:hypothetical protein